jgi:hypothetical protein
MTERDITKGIANTTSFQSVIKAKQERRPLHKKINTVKTKSVKTKSVKTKSIKTETYFYVFESCEARTLFCQSILAMQHSGHICFQYDGERWATALVLEYDGKV